MISISIQQIFNPVIMAGGLWSDITAWDEAGKEIAAGFQDNLIMADSIKYSPRDVWLIELTGGPGTECDTCADYTYGDLINKYWPALVGGAIKLAGNKYPVAYVGHSNGARVALDALKNLNGNQKTNAGKLSDGTSYNLPANPVDSYIGVGVPGNFSNPTLYTLDVNDGRGDKMLKALISKTHIRVAEVGVSLKTLSGWVTQLISAQDQQKISRNLLTFYINIANSTRDMQPGIGITLPKAMIIYGDNTIDSPYSSDWIVPSSDPISIYNGIISADKKIERTGAAHIFQINANDVKTKIKRRLDE